MVKVQRPSDSAWRSGNSSRADAMGPGAMDDKGGQGCSEGQLWGAYSGPIQRLPHLCPIRMWRLNGKYGLLLGRFWSIQSFRHLFSLLARLSHSTLLPLAQIFICGLAVSCSSLLGGLSDLLALSGALVNFSLLGSCKYCYHLFKYFFSDWKTNGRLPNAKGTQRILPPYWVESFLLSLLHYQNNHFSPVLWTWVVFIHCVDGLSPGDRICISLVRNGKPHSCQL